MHHRTPKISERLRAAPSRFQAPKCGLNRRASNARSCAQPLTTSAPIFDGLALDNVGYAQTSSR